MTANLIPFLDLDRQHAELRQDLLAAFERVLDASAFIGGEEVERFEDEFARYCGVAHCVGTASGTAALTIALAAAGIRPGDEVIVPSHTFIASALAIVHAGAVPVLCDVHDGTGLIDAGSAEAVVSERTAAILAVHLYGQLCDMEAVARAGAIATACWCSRTQRRLTGQAPWAGAPDPSARPRASAFIRARTSARSATAARSPRTMSTLPSAPGACAISASGPGTSTSKRVGTNGWMACRPPSYAQSCPDWTTGTGPGETALPHIARRSERQRVSSKS